MPIITGTCYFPTRQHAIDHYRPYLGDPYYLGGDTTPVKTKMEKDIECNKWVGQKIFNGEIHIGKPPIKNGETLFIQDNRYHIQSK